MKNQIRYVPKKFARLNYILAILTICFLLWVFLSWIEVNMHNKAPYYNYSELNFFKFLIRGDEDEISRESNRHYDDTYYVDVDGKIYSYTGKNQNN